MGKNAKVIAAKEFLQRIKIQDTHINNKLQELAQLRLLATKITSTLNPAPVSGGGNSDKIGDAVAKIVDMGSEIDKEINLYINVKRDVCHILDQIQDPDQLDVLQKRYVLHETLEEIAKEKHMSYRNVCYIHGRALQAVAALIDERVGNDAER